MPDQRLLKFMFSMSRDSLIQVLAERGCRSFVPDPPCLKLMSSMLRNNVIQTDRHTDRQTETDRRANRHTDRQTDPWQTHSNLLLVRCHELV